MIETHLCPDAPKPLGNYSHASFDGDRIYICGMGPRQAETNEIPGLTFGPDGEKLSYDIRAETKATIENLKTILESCGSDLNHLLEVTVFLVDMEDFKTYNEVYGEYFQTHQPVRTTLGVAALPGPISIEMKAVAVKKK